jgi:SIR2-like domain
VIWGSQDRSTVFLLGAGATRGAFHHVTINRKRVKAPLNYDFFPILKTFVDANANNRALTSRYNRLRHVFRHEFPTRGKWPLSMEDAFSLLYVSKDFPEIYGNRGRKRKPGIRREIEDFLRLTFGILTSIESFVPPDNLYRHLARSLNTNDVIITLNYDTLLDAALLQRGWNPINGYGLTGGAKKIRWEVPGRVASDALRGVSLLKLHGSLNWYVRGNYGNLQRVFDNKPSKVIASVRPRINEMDGFIRQIIPPIHGKFFRHSHWRRLWELAFNALITSDVLAVVGCSLAETDFHLSGMLGHAVATRKERANPFHAVALVDRARTRRKWSRLLAGCASKKIFASSFQDFAREFLQEGQ